jgi:xanthine dehydrogenase accessory factor
LQAPVAYVGAIGSQRRWLTAANALREMGVSNDLPKLVQAPAGLELNAETPEEIAISIMAEIIMLRRGQDGRPMSEGGQ